MTANIRTPQRTVSAMQRFAVSQKNHAEAITISPFLLSLPYRTENRRFSALSCAKTGSTQPKLSAACFVQSCFAVAEFVVFSNYCLIGTRPLPFPFIEAAFTVIRSASLMLEFHSLGPGMTVLPAAPFSSTAITRFVCMTIRLWSAFLGTAREYDDHRGPDPDCRTAYSLLPPGFRSISSVKGHS